MRKTTVVAMAIILLACGAMIALFKAYTGEIIPEIERARALTREIEPALAAGTRIRLRRVPSGADYLVRDDRAPGLILEADPSADTWSRDRGATGFARDAALRLFEAYDLERPIEWIQFRLRKPDGTASKEFAVRRGEGGVGVQFLDAAKPEGAPGGR
jgi:hypothetical protein